MSYSDKHYGAGKKDCPICDGVGYFRYSVPDEHPYFGKAFDCSCREENAETSRQTYLRRVGGLEYLADKRLDTFNPDGSHPAPHHQASLRRAFETIERYAENPDGWLMLIGGYGCGKTHLAAAIANARLDAGEKVTFVTVPDLLDYLRSAFAPTASDGQGYQSRFDEVRTTPLLILDDLGIESPTAWAIEKLYQILNHRYNAKLPTVITTNHRLEELERRLRSRLSDLDLSQILYITAPDYRQGGGTPAQSDLNSLGLYKHMTFDSFDLNRELPPNAGQHLRRVFDGIHRYAQSPEGWLLIFGDYGTGKTHFAAAIANLNTDRGNPALFVTIPDLLDHLRASFAPNSPVTYDKRFNEVKTAPLLILDDLGTESATPWAREKLYQLFNYRYNAHLPTVITTSHEPHELEKKNPRLFSRLRDKRICIQTAIDVPAYVGR